MQSIMIQGNLTRDPELKEITTGSKNVTVANFSIAETRKFTRADGTKDEETTFINCESWEGGAKLIGDLMHKGDPILVQGVLKTDSWEKDGQKFSRLKLRVERFQKLYRKSQVESDASTGSAEPVPVAAATGEDIPF
jgi:single-strand DNA-binding protein